MTPSSDSVDAAKAALIRRITAELQEAKLRLIVAHLRATGHPAPETAAHLVVYGSQPARHGQ